MKVVALIPKRYALDTMLVEMDAIEVGLITSGKLETRALPVGTEVQVEAHWKRVRDIDCAQIDLNNAARSLRSLADLLETIPVVVPPHPEPEPVKEGGAV